MERKKFNSFYDFEKYMREQEENEKREKETAEFTDKDICFETNCCNH